MMRRLSRWSVLPVLMLSSCVIPSTIEMLDDSSPPPEFGRPAWVRTCAGVGGWLGAIAGGVVSIVTLPVTYPLSLMADDGFGEHSSDEFLLAPAVGMSAVGHVFLGIPADLIDWTFRRAWITPIDPVTDFTLTPLDNFEPPKPNTSQTDS